MQQSVHSLPRSDPHAKARLAAPLRRGYTIHRIPSRGLNIRLHGRPARTV